MIEIGKHYIIEARFKKRVTEVEFYEKNDDTILYDTLWRNGEFRIEPATQGECEYIQKFIDLDEDSFEEFDLNTFYSMEMDGTFDGKQQIVPNRFNHESLFSPTALLQTEIKCLESIFDGFRGNDDSQVHIGMLSLKFAHAWGQNSTAQTHVRIDRERLGIPAFQP